MVHEYGDHVSLDKFVEFNWNTGTIAPSGRDNLPNPVATQANPWVPTNMPTIGDMTSYFNFPK
jgi:phospholipase C